MHHTTNFKKPISVDEWFIVTIRYVILLVLKNNQHYKTLHKKIKNIVDNYEASRIVKFLGSAMYTLHEIVLE